MKKMILMLTALVGLCAPKAVQAVDVEGVYVGGFVGANWANFKKGDHHHDNDIDGSTGRRSRKYDTGWLGGLHVGYRFCGGWRVEAEGSYRDNQAKKRKNHHHEETLLGDNEGHHHKSHRGNLHTWSFMVNGLYEIPLCWCVTPYIGAGIGYDNTEAPHRRRSHHNVIGDNENDHHRKHKRKENGFAWQIIAGALYPIDDCLELGLEYRFHHGKNKDLYNNAVDLRLNWFF